MQMKAFKYFTMSAVLISGVISDVYAGMPGYIKSYGINTPEGGIYNFFKAIYYIVMFALILAAAYYVTKFLAKKGMVQGKTKTMKVVESMPLGVDKSLHLIKVGTQYFLIGSASKNMFLISELDEEKLFQCQEGDILNLDEIEAAGYKEAIQAKDFKDYLSSVKQNVHKLKSIVRGSNDNEE